MVPTAPPAAIRLRLAPLQQAQLKSLLGLGAALALAPWATAVQTNLGSHTFSLPPGFTIELAAPSTLVPRPIEADFDDQGRLYVTDSSGTNDKVSKQLADKPHRVLRLEDTNGDGVFDTSVVFADKMMFPEGCLWLEGSLFVSAPPSIWKLTDTNNDGVADVRVEWFQGKSLGGCANDLHGPYLGPDGWIYWCKGGFERQTNILGNGKTFVSRASHIWRARPDGSGLEPIMTGGMDNPVGLAWTGEGEPIVSGTFFQHPGGGKRDGLIHVLYGGVYGKDNDVLEGHVRTGDLLPIMTHLGPAAPCGMIATDGATQFESVWQGSLVVCSFNLHKLTRHALVQASTKYSATYQTPSADLLVSDNPDFHPTDVLQDADGSLLVVDTGGWYKLCCPTSQLPKPDVLGGIYRIRRPNPPRPPLQDPRGLNIRWAEKEPAELTAYFAERRREVRNRAARELARRGEQAVPALTRQLRVAHSSDLAVWTLTQIDSPRAREAVRLALEQSSGLALTAAAHSIALWRDTGAFPQALDHLQRQTNAARQAATALGRMGDKRAVPALLKKATEPIDRAFEHALIYALIEIGDVTGTRAGLSSEDPAVRRVALIALDQMPDGQLKPDEVTPLLASTNAVLKQTANWIVSHRPEWAGTLAGFFKERLAADLADSDRVELQRQLAQFARQPAIQDLLADAAWKGNSTARVTALRAMASSSVKETPAIWATALAYGVIDANRDVVQQAIATTRALPASKMNGGNLGLYLSRLATSNYPVALRIDALAAMPQPRWSAEDETVALLLSGLRADQPVSQRSAAITALGKLRLSESQISQLADALREAGPMELPRLLPLFVGATNEALGLRLLDALQASKSFRSLQAEQVRPCVTNFPTAVRTKADALLASLNADVARQKQDLDDLANKLALNVDKPDIRRGQALFNSQKAACATCHAIGYLGGNLGPDLTRIGQVRTERDLLEAIVFPSASFVRSYEPVFVLTKSGDEHSGVLRRDAPDEIVLATGANAEVRLARADIAEMRPGTVSVMPAGLNEQLTRQEMADLLAFLKATKW